LFLVLAALALGIAVGSIPEVLRSVGDVGLGTILGLLVSRYYSKRASVVLWSEAEALREETEKLRDHTTLILRGFEEGGSRGISNGTATNRVRS
jgi:hypothetical protein